MSLRSIPVHDRVEQTRVRREVVWDGVRIFLTFFTNREDGLWYLDVDDADGVRMLSGIGVVAGLNLFAQYRYMDLPPGILFVVDHTGAKRDPTLDSFLVGDMTVYYQDA